MKQFITAVLLTAVAAVSHGATGGYPLDEVSINLNNKASLQRGAKLFVNYCQACHSAQYQRYNRLARDLGLEEDMVAENLIFTSTVNDQGQMEKTGIAEQMVNAMGKKDGEQWFGKAPPDLTLIARSKGVDYLYTYLRTFYLDESRPFGVNNAVLAGASMPHVLWELQGWQRPIYHDDPEHAGGGHGPIEGFEVVQAGLMTVPEFDAAMADLVNFLAYIAEPARLQRESLGIWVLLFLLAAFGVFYLLKKEYWRDIH